MVQDMSLLTTPDPRRRTTHRHRRRTHPVGV